MPRTEYRSALGNIGVITDDATGKPLWLYALERGAPGRYAIVWVYVDTPGPPRVLVATEAAVSRWNSLPGLAASSSEPAGSESLKRLLLQNGKAFEVPGAAALVYREDGDTGYRQAQVLFDPYAAGTPTLIAQIGRAPETFEPPPQGIRITPRSAASAVGLPTSAFSSSLGLGASPVGTPAAPTAPPTFGNAGGSGGGGALPTSTAVPALALLALAGLLLFRTTPR